MPDLIDDKLARLAADVAHEFRPAPLNAVHDAVRRRRRARRALLSLAVVAVVAVPATVAVTLTRGGPQVAPGEPTPAVTGTPTVSTAPPVPVESRQMVVPGFDATTRWWVSFTDAEHAWAWAYGLNPPGLAATSDGGRTWRAISAPIPKDVAVNIYPLDGEIVTLNILVPELEGTDSFLLTTDGGRTFSTHPQHEPPLQALQAYARELGSDGYTLLCPGQTGFLDGGEAPECEREWLTRLGYPALDQQPQVGGSPNNASYLKVGGDGRLWLFNNDPGLPHLQVSADDAGTWQSAAAPAEEIIDLLTSPDGEDVWLFTRTHVYLLVDEVWQLQDVESRVALTGAFTALDGGILLVPGTGGAGVTVYQDGASHPLVGVPAGITYLEQLPDGTFLANDTDQTFIGIGEGFERTWVQILH